MFGFHSISFSCEKREAEESFIFGLDLVSIQLVSLARRETQQPILTILQTLSSFHSISFSCEKREEML